MEKKVFFIFLLVMIMTSCTNYKKVCTEKENSIIKLKDSLTLVLSYNEELKSSLIFKTKESRKFYQENKIIKELEDSLSFYSNIEQKHFLGRIFNNIGPLYENDPDYRIIRQTGSAFYGAKDVEDFFIYKYENLLVFNGEELRFEISYLNADKRGIWVKEESVDYFHYLSYEDLTPGFQEFYKNNFLDK